jgi:hypothetical protein
MDTNSDSHGGKKFMERAEEDLIARHISRDEELRKCVECHKGLENDLEGFNRRIHLTPKEEMEKKGVQKRKLVEKDKILKILSRYREIET